MLQLRCVDPSVMLLDPGECRALPAAASGRIVRRMLIADIIVGAAVSTARVGGIIAALLLPAIALRQRSRRSCYVAAAGYHAAALWALAVGAKNFFGPHVSVMVVIAFWTVCALPLALPYALLWMERTSRLLGRAPLAVLIGIIPPLGLIGFASPVTASGFLFEDWSWVGFALAVGGCGLVAAYPRFGILSIAFPRCKPVVLRRTAAAKSGSLGYALRRDQPRPNQCPA